MATLQVTRTLFASASAALAFSSASLTAGTVSGQPREEKNAVSANRPWTPGDTLETRLPGLGRDFPSIGPGGTDFGGWANSALPRRSGIEISPDGRFFFWVSRWVDAKGDRAIGRIQVFSAAHVRSAITQGKARAVPLWERTFFDPAPDRADMHDRAILDAYWDDGGASIVVRTMPRGRETFQALRAADGALKMLFQQSEDAAERMSGAVGPRNRYISRGQRHFRIHSPEFTVRGEIRPRYPMEFLPRDKNGSASHISQWQLAKGDLSFQQNCVLVEPGGEPIYPLHIGTRCTELVPSPDGSLVAFNEMGSDGGVFSITRLGRNGIEERLMRAGILGPITRGDFSVSQLFWTSGGRQLLVVGAHLPERKGGNLIAVYDLDTGQWTVLDQLTTNEQVEGTLWAQSDNRLLLTLSRGPGEGQFAEKRFQIAHKSYALADGRWSVAEVPDEDALTRTSDLTLEVRQGVNEPPLLVAEMGGRELQLTEPDPVFARARFTRALPFNWRERDGIERQGALLLPANYRRGEPVPLVIQPYHYYSSTFAPEGYPGTADAAQSLAARGIAVLRIQTYDLMSGDPDEGLRIGERLDAVIDELVARNITRPDKIGISGFSRAGFNIHVQITHPARTAFASAVIADSFTGYYSSYLESIAEGDWRGASWPENGGIFWRDTMSWLTYEPSFNADRIVTPALFTAHVGRDPFERPLTGWNSMSFLIDELGATRANGKPAEFAFFAEGHQLANHSRLALLELVVDWHAFWLKGEEDPAPHKARQYERWRVMRGNWRAEQAKTQTSGEEGFITTRAGLSYRIETRRTGIAPVTGDVVRFRFKRKDGPADDQGDILSVKLGDPVPVLLSAGTITADRDTRSVDGLGKGWDEGLRLMHPGERATLIMRPALAQLPGRGTATGDEPIRFEVELIEFASARDTAIAEMKAAGMAVPADWSELNRLGYKALYEERNSAKAIRFFDWNLALFPDDRPISATRAAMYDSLAEGWLIAGDVDRSLDAYRRALARQPQIQSSARSVVEQLEANSSSLPYLQHRARDTYTRSIQKAAQTEE